MKHIFLSGLILLLPVCAIAQEKAYTDTTIFIGNKKLEIKESAEKIKVKIFEPSSSGDTIENDQIFEGVYKDGKSTERRIILSAPFYRKHKNNLVGFYLGMNNFACKGDINLSQIRSWEVGMYLFEADIPLGKSKKWSIVTGIGFKGNWYGYNGNRAFREENGVTKWLPAPEGKVYTSSSFYHFSTIIPVLLSWQTPRKKNPFFVQGGIEADIRAIPGCTVKYKDENGKKHKENYRDRNAEPGGGNIFLHLGIGELGIYGRYSIDRLFEKGKGPDVRPFSIGISWTL